MSILQKCQDLHIEWYERLQKWEEAKKMYETKLYCSDFYRSRESNTSFDFTQKLGYLRSLEALGEW